MTRTGSITLNQDTVSVITSPGQTHTVRWAEVEQISVWKRDCFGTDQINLGLTGAETCLRFTEDDLGWRALMQELERRFGVAERDWWHRVIHPAFAPKEIVLWSRHETADSP